MTAPVDPPSVRRHLVPMSPISSRIWPPERPTAENRPPQQFIVSLAHTADPRRLTKYITRADQTGISPTRPTIAGLTPRPERPAKPARSATATNRTAWQTAHAHHAAMAGSMSFHAVVTRCFRQHQAGTGASSRAYQGHGRLGLSKPLPARRTYMIPTRVEESSTIHLLRVFLPAAGLPGHRRLGKPAWTPPTNCYKLCDQTCPGPSGSRPLADRNSRTGQYVIGQ